MMCRGRFVRTRSSPSASDARLRRARRAEQRCGDGDGDEARDQLRAVRARVARAQHGRRKQRQRVQGQLVEQLHAVAAQRGEDGRAETGPRCVATRWNKKWREQGVTWGYEGQSDRVWEARGFHRHKSTVDDERFRPGHG
eukprot:6206574-Pleurochrysis_carterae.AAC.1